MYKILHIPTSQYVVRVVDSNFILYGHHFLVSQAYTWLPADLDLAYHFPSDENIPWEYILQDLVFNHPRRSRIEYTQEEFEIIEVNDETT